MLAPEQRSLLLVLTKPSNVVCVCVCARVRVCVNKRVRVQFLERHITARKLSGSETTGSPWNTTLAYLSAVVISRVLQRTIRATAARLPSRGLEYQTSGDPDRAPFNCFPICKQLPKGCVYCSPLHYCHVAERASPSVAVCALSFEFQLSPAVWFLLHRAAQKSFCLILGSRSPFPKVISIIISLSNGCHFMAWRTECRQEIWVIYTHTHTEAKVTTEINTVVSLFQQLRESVFTFWV